MAIGAPLEAGGWRKNGPFIDDFPIKTSIYEGFSLAMLNNQMLILLKYKILVKNHHKFSDGTL